MSRMFTTIGLCLLLCGAVTATAQFNGMDDHRESSSSSSSSGKISLNAQAGYSFGAFIRGYDGEVTLPGSPWVGGAIDFAIKRDIMIELSYMYRTCDMMFFSYNGYGGGISDNLGMISTHYIQVGSLKTFRKGKVAPFIGGNLGVGIYSPEKQNYETNVFFTVSGLGGAKIYLSEKFGLRLQGRLLLPIYFGGLSFYCGTGGCGSGISGTGTVEGELSGGLFIQL